MSDARALVTSDAPAATRWEREFTGERWQEYADRFDRHHVAGDDLEGEARFVDMMAARGSAVLDAGCGTGRVAAALTRMGHRAIGVDKDAGLVEIARSRYPGVPYLVHDLAALHSDAMTEAGGPGEFDLIAVPGNVMVFLAPGTERAVLQNLAGLLVADGRLVCGFATDRQYTVGQLDLDAAAVGLVAEHRFATWHLDPWTADAGWAVSVFRRP